MSADTDIDTDTEFRTASEVAEDEIEDERNASCERCREERVLFELRGTTSYHGVCNECLATLPRRDDDRRPELAAAADRDYQVRGLVEDEIARDGGPRRAVVGTLNRERERFTEDSA